MLLEEGWGYFAGVGGSCSTHNLRPVDPHPRGVGRLEDGARAEPTSSRRREAAREPGGNHKGPGQRSGRRKAGPAPGVRAPGATAKTSPDLAESSTSAAQCPRC